MYVLFVLWMIPHFEVLRDGTQISQLDLLLYNQIILAHLDFIKPICLPTSDYLRSLEYDGIYLEVAGWGKTENGLLQKICSH